MTEKFIEELDRLQADTFEMGQLAVGMLADSVKALKTQDIDLAQSVLEKKTDLAEMDLEIEKRALQLLTLYQPMATDMRKLATILKTITYLARIGRYGKDIANITIELGDQSHISKLVSIPLMSKMVGSMIEDSLEAFEEGDITKLADLGERDDEVDAMRYTILRECITYMMEDPKNISRCANYIMIARYLERCADHSCKIAEKVTYMVTGEHVEIR